MTNLELHAPVSDAVYMSENGCEPCARDFLSESALSQHRETVHGSDGAQHHYAKERKKAAGSSKAKTKPRVTGSDKAELSMHSCEPCSRPFAGERALFQHAAAVHNYDERADRANAGITGAPDYVLGLAPWEQGERRLIISKDDSGLRILKEYDTLYSDQAKASTHQQSGNHGSATSVSGLSCNSCDRAFLTVRGLNDHASAVHQDEALEATYDERRELVANHIRKTINSANSYNRIYCYVIDMTDTFVVYQVEGMENSYQADYAISDDGVVTLGDASPVRRRTVYEPIGSAS